MSKPFPDLPEDFLVNTINDVLHCPPTSLEGFTALDQARRIANQCYQPIQDVLEELKAVHADAIASYDDDNFTDLQMERDRLEDRVAELEKDIEAESEKRGRWG